MHIADDLASSWLAALAARGVSVIVRGNRLGFSPKHAYNGILTTEERLIAKEHKVAIIARIQSGAPILVSSPVALANATTTPTPAPAPVPICPFCMGTCVGQDHPAFNTLHARDEADIWRRRTEQREKDTHEWELRRVFGLPSPRWDL